MSCDLTQIASKVICNVEDAHRKTEQENVENKLWAISNRFNFHYFSLLSFIRPVIYLINNWLIIVSMCRVNVKGSQYCRHRCL